LRQQAFTLILASAPMVRFSDFFSDIALPPYLSTELSLNEAPDPSRGKAREERLWRLSRLFAKRSRCDLIKDLRNFLLSRLTSQLTWGFFAE
jgi:hypothetical protein